MITDPLPITAAFAAFLSSMHEGSRRSLWYRVDDRTSDDPTNVEPDIQPDDNPEATKNARHQKAITLPSSLLELPLPSSLTTTSIQQSTTNTMVILAKTTTTYHQRQLTTTTTTIIFVKTTTIIVVLPYNYNTIDDN
jgi:hypothetical protein